MTVFDINNVEIKPICKTGSNRIFPVLGIFYMVSLILVLMIWPFMGLDFAFTTGITFFTGCLLVRAIWKDARNSYWSRIITEKSAPGFLWLLFGVGAVISMLRLKSMRYYGEYEDSTVLLMSLYALLGAAFYVIGFRLINRTSNQNQMNKDFGSSSGWVIILLLFLLFIDWYMNIRLIKNGLFFIWITKVGLNKSLRGDDFFYHIYRTTHYVIIPLLLYLISIYRKKTIHVWLFKGVILLQLLIIVLRGERVVLIEAGVVFIFSYALVYQRKLEIKWILVGFLIMILFFGILSPVIQESRILMREDSSLLNKDPISIPLKYITEYIPKVFTPEYIFGDEKISRREVGVIGRFGSYMSYAASMYQAYLDGVPLRSIDDLYLTLQTLIPRFLYPRKLSIDADALLLEHFGMGRPGSDSNGNPFSDVFSYIHVFGVTILFAIMGLGLGFVTRHLEFNYGIVGKLILIGLFPVFLPDTDNFVGYLVNLRNVLLFVSLIAVIFRFNRALSKQKIPIRH